MRATIRTLVMTAGPGDPFLANLAQDLDHRFSIDHATVQAEAAT